MASILMGAVIVVDGQTTATYYNDEGAVNTKSSDWPQDVTDSSASLVASCQAQLPQYGTVSSIQVYTKITDPDGFPPYSAPGQVVDVYFGSPQYVRLGDTAAVPDDIAKNRDLFKLAVETAL